MAFGVMNAFAQTVKVDDVTIKAGETKVVSINLSNSQSNIVSFQMDLTLPDGITLNKAGCGLGSRITDNDQELTIGKQPNGDYRLTSTSFALKPISGSTGEIIELSLTAASNAKGGTASLKNILFATSNSESLTADNTTFKVNPTYTLTYILDGQVYRTENLVYGTPIDPEPALKKTGYTFSGWSEIPETMPNHDVTVTGSFTINSYTLTYKVDGQVYKTSTVVYGTAITPEAEPTKEGYTFSGWNGLPETMPANDVVVTGSFTINSYNLTYILDGEVYKTESIVYGTSIDPEPALKKTGYTFSGWSEIPATMPAHDVTVTGSFTINSYTLTYKVDEQIYKTSTVVYGTVLTPEAEPTKEGYTFSGWNGLPETMPANDVVVTGTFTINSYTLTYIVDGEVYKKESIVYGTPIDPEPALKKTGYTFSGWSEIPATMPAHDVTVTGSFTINKYKMTYIVDGAEYKSYEIDYGTAITPEAAPTKEGHTFSGWSEIPATMPAHDVTVTGTFSINSYKLTYLLNGEEYLSETVVYGTPLTPEPAIKKEGYTFSGWSGLPETMPAHDVTVTGTLTVNNYKLTYKVDGAVYKTLTVAYGTAITPEAAPTKEGYTFSGWSEIPATMPAHDVEVNGTFSINSYTLTYKVDGETYKTSTVVYGTAITPEPAPTKEGHTFSGWSTIPTTMPAHDVIVTGTFTVNNYTLTYLVDGKAYKTSSVAFGTPLTAEPAPTKEGHTFSGWSEIPATMPAHDVTVTGTFTVNSYTLTYILDGSVYRTETVVYGTPLTPEPALQKEGYTFSGWSGLPETMPAHDVTVTGSFSINSYKLTYKVDGVVYKTSTVVYGTPITPEAEPTKEGHTFSGWSEIPSTMPASDVEVTGTFTVNSYTLTYMLDGKEYKTSTIAYGTAITPEANPTKEGYTFSGWSEIPAKMPAHDVVVTGSFSINSYNLTYKVDGVVYKTSTVVYGTAITPEEEPVKEGHTFSGWSEIPDKMPAHDVTVSGSFTINKYKLTYMVDGAVYKSYEMEYATTITPEAAPTKEGHTFSGWSEIPAKMPAHDVTVTGSFRINSYTLTYKVDGEVYKTSTVVYGTALTPEPAPTKEGHTFSGWSEIPATMPAHDVEVTGSFSINSYTLTYMVDGEVYKTVSVVYGTTITSEAEPTKEGYTFSGWSEIPKTMPAKDVVVTGSFSINSYTLTYVVDGNVYKTYSVVYGTTLTPEAEPTRSGYTFSGWSEIPETMPAEDVTVTGSFIIKLATDIALDRDALLFNTIDPQQLSVRLAPADLVNKTVRWSSTNLNIATVDEKGVVTPVDNGEAFIIVSTTDGSDLKDTCMVTVDFKAATLNIDREEMAITELKSQKLTAIVTPKGASQIVTWSSTNAGIVAVDGTGTIKPLKNGEAAIVATTADGTQLTDTCLVTVDIPSLFEASVTQTTLTIGTRSGMAEAKNVKLTIDGDVYDGAMVTGLAPNRTYHIKATADIGEYNWTEELDATTADIAVNFDCEATPTTLAVSASYDAGDATVTSASFSSEEEVNTLSLTGLDPSQTYEYTYYITTEEGGTMTYKATFATEALDFATLQPKVVSLGNVIVAAESNLNDEETNVGFEWRCIDWTDDFTSNSGEAYLYEGMMEGYIHDLNTDKLWKYRPYYESNAGNRYYGGWVGIDPTDIAYFEPTVHTYSSVTVTGNSVKVKGYAMQGTENVTSQGFMYWSTNSPSSRMKVSGIPDNAKTVLLNGYVMTVVLEGLEYDTEYCCVAFITTSEGETFYGEEQTFTTGPIDPDGIEDVKAAKDVTEIARYDIQGRKLDKPQKGINIIRYSDGTSRKVLVK